MQMPTRRDLRIAHQKFNNSMSRLNGLVSRRQVTTGNDGKSAWKFLVWNLCLFHCLRFLKLRTADAAAGLHGCKEKRSAWDLRQHSCEWSVMGAEWIRVRV